MEAVVGIDSGYIMHFGDMVCGWERGSCVYIWRDGEPGYASLLGGLGRGREVDIRDKGERGREGAGGVYIPHT